MARKKAARSEPQRVKETTTKTGDDRRPKALKKPSSVRRGIVAPKDEQGVPYPGDWPNPAGDRPSGCF